MDFGLIVAANNLDLYQTKNGIILVFSLILFDLSSKNNEHPQSRVQIRDCFYGQFVEVDRFFFSANRIELSIIVIIIFNA